MTDTAKFRYCLVSENDNKNFSIKTTSQLIEDKAIILTVNKDDNPIMGQRRLGFQDPRNLNIMKSLSSLSSGEEYKIEFTKIVDSQDHNTYDDYGSITEEKTSDLTESCNYDKSQSEGIYGLQIVSVSCSRTISPKAGYYRDKAYTLRETFTLRRKPIEISNDPIEISDDIKKKQQLKIDPTFPLWSLKYKPRDNQRVLLDEKYTGYNILIKPKEVAIGKLGTPILNVLIINCQGKSVIEILNKLNMTYVEKYYAGTYYSESKFSESGVFINCQLYSNSGLTCDIDRDGQIIWYGHRDFFRSIPISGGSHKSKKKSSIRMKKRISKKKINKTSKNLRKKKNKKYISKRRGI